MTLLIKNTIIALSKIIVSILLVYGSFSSAPPAVCSSSN